MTKFHTNYTKPMVFVVVHVSEPGMQVNSAVFESEEDATVASLAILEERAPNYDINFQSAYERYGNDLISEWHSITRYMERIEVFQCPINILQGE
jgi:hypothetical protein